ncbi:MAG TPA: hypothetical protein C5S51_09230 [Methanosarcinaceae archaeon]|nr:hypothetical protein [Methanosarcinaceae archaeon]
MNEAELIGLVISQDVMLLTMVILCFLGLVAVPVHWLILAKRALDRGRVRVESASNCMVEMSENDD